MSHDALQRPQGDQAQIDGARCRFDRLGLELTPGLMQIEFLLAEYQGAAPGAEALVAHAQHALIEIDGGVDIRHRQYQMVQSLDHAQCLSRR